MTLKVVQIQLNWPQEVSAVELKSWVLCHLQKYGEPLRWAITKVESVSAESASRELSLEAVIVIPNQVNRGSK